MTTIHVLPNPSGITSERYRTDAFGIAACKFIRSMPIHGYELVHYGHSASEVSCENVVIMHDSDLPRPDDPGTMLYHRGDLNHVFCERVRGELARRVKPGDIVASFYGSAHVESVRDIGSRAFVVEPAIGYPVDTVFANYRGFVSYAWMHYYYGHHQKLMTPNWFDRVIPNAFEVDEFEFSSQKQDYFVYLGRMIHHKGIDLAIQVTRELGAELVIASSGPLSDIGYAETPSHVREIGYVDQQQRRSLLANARCLLAPTYYIEPFGNIVIEAALSGTPVLTSDWGGFTENVQHGVTGYRCRDFNQFLHGADSIQRGEISAQACRDWAIAHYDLPVVHAQMHDWFQTITRHDFYYTDYRNSCATS